MKKKTPAVDPRAALVDELGDLQLQAAPLNDRIKVIKGELQLSVAGKPADTPCHIWGTRFEAVLGACKKARRIVNMLKLYKLLGQERFLERCSFPLAAVDEFLNLQERASVLIEERTSTRELSIVPLAAAKTVAA